MSANKYDIEYLVVAVGLHPFYLHLMSFKINAF